LLPIFQPHARGTRSGYIAFHTNAAEVQLSILCPFSRLTAKLRGTANINGICCTLLAMHRSRREPVTDLPSIFPSWTFWSKCHRAKKEKKKSHNSRGTNSQPPTERPTAI
ncbi:hypothetical protein TGAM01_v200661, partial [Trichoderma gamsii]